MESLGAEKFGGYNAHFLQELLDEYECPVCKMALREPVVTDCGHRFCYSCSEEITKRNNCKFICPFDKSILNSKQIYPDKFTERKILQLYVKCDNFIKRCQWTGELKKLNNHLTCCKYQEVQCLNEKCSTTLLRKQLIDHMKNDCSYRWVTCQYCKQNIIFCDNQIHEDKCECFPLCCVNQCGMKILRKEMFCHITDSCANTIITCQYVNIGCQYKGIRKEHETHANSSMQNHLSMAISKLEALDNKTLTIMSTVDALENKVSKIEALETEIFSKADAFEKKITSKVEFIENKNTLEVVALENNITSTVDVLKYEFISKMDKQKDKMLYNENLRIKNASLSVKTDMSRDQYKSMNINEIATKMIELENKLDAVIEFISVHFLSNLKVD